MSMNQPVTFLDPEDNVPSSFSQQAEQEAANKEYENLAYGKGAQIQQGAVQQGGAVPTSPVGGGVVKTAMSALGTKYVWGGNSLKNGVDCSGLIAAAYAANGKQIPRTAAAQQKAAKRVAGKDAQPGDLVFWEVAGSKDRVPGADHVGIYLGDGMVLEASSSQGKVVVRKLWGNYQFGRI